LPEIIIYLFFKKKINKQFPATHEATLNHGTKSVTAMSCDPNGARLATGSIDFDVKLWDFAGMVTGLRYFRSFQPSGR
jgi:WD repeat-containing protein 70